MTPPSRRPSILAAALRGRCPNCGEGPLFRGFLALRESCPVCAENFAAADTGDGPAVFVMFPVGAAAVVAAAVFEFVLHAPPLITIAVTFVITIILSLSLLRPFKAALFALQWRLKAQEGRLQD